MFVSFLKQNRMSLKALSLLPMPEPGQNPLEYEYIFHICGTLQEKTHSSYVVIIFKSFDPFSNILETIRMS